MNWKIAIVFIVTLSSLLLWQNCSPKHSGGGDAGLYTIDAAKPIYSQYHLKSLAKNLDLKFIASAGIVAAGTKNIYWDNSLNGTEFCNQKPTDNPLRIIINCPSAGELVLSVFVELTNGDVMPYDVIVPILEEAEQPIDPNPVELDGQTLYVQNCMGCHGANDKKGRSAASIQNAINSNTGGMGFLNVLTAEEVQAIADYLN